MRDKRLGIYFGRDRLTLVEIFRKSVVKQADMDISRLSVQSARDLIEWVEKVRSFIKENNFTTKEAVVGLSGDDLFIRGFQMPHLARSEIAPGIDFEVRKYLPFRQEELIFDYQYRFDKALNKTDVLYIAANKNNFERAGLLFKEIGLQLKAVESAGLALFRLLVLSRQLSYKQTIMIVTLYGRSNAEFSVVKDGLPCFSREVKLSLEAFASGGSEYVITERLGSEIRIFLDYFKRQFSVSSVDKIIFFSDSIDPGIISSLNQGIGISTQLFQRPEALQLSQLTNLDGLKAYASALRGMVKLDLSVNLLRNVHRRDTASQKSYSGRHFRFGLAMLKLPLILAAILIGIAYGISLPEQRSASISLRQTIKEAESVLGGELNGLDLPALKKRKAVGMEKLSSIRFLISSRLYITEALNLFPRIIKDGIWIDSLDISLKDKARFMSLKGGVYQGGEGPEKKAVDSLLGLLMDNSGPLGGMSNFKISSVERRSGDKFEFTVFEIFGD